MTDIYRLVYTSRNLLHGSEDERVAVVAQILATSQRNNSKVGVTGALLFNGGSFAQVLEGPRSGVESTFERIQRDIRHSDVNVLQCEPVATRGFIRWSMAFVGQSPRGRALWNEIAGRTGFDLSRIEGDQLYATLHALVLDEEGIKPDAQPVTRAPVPPSRSISGLDIERVRAELHQTAAERGAAPTMPSPGETAAAPPVLVPNPETADRHGIETSVLRAALAEERERTSGLRSALDEAHIALAIATARAEALLRHRDVWAERAKALVTAFCQDDSEDGGGEVSPRVTIETSPALSPVRKVA